MFRFLIRGWFWIGVLKVFMLLFVVAMIVIQIPELRYDMLGDRPVIIDSPADLDPFLLTGTSYAKIRARPTFEYGFNYERYGLTFTYFTLEPYGLQIIARGYDLNPDDFAGPIQLEGKLRPFASQPFAHAIWDIFYDQNGVYPADNAYYFGVGDVPAANGWQLGSIIFATVLFVVMFYFFYLFPQSRTRKLFSDPFHGIEPYKENSK